MSELTTDEKLDQLIRGIEQSNKMMRVLAEVTRDMARTHEWKNERVEQIMQAYIDSYDEVYV